MADANFNVKNGLVVNGSFVANSTTVNAAAITATSLRTGNSTSNVVITANTLTISNGSLTVTGNNTTFGSTNLNVTALTAISNNVSALVGSSTSNNGILGVSNTGTGVVGVSNTSTGVYGQASGSAPSAGMHGENLGGGTAILASANSGIGATIQSKTGAPLYVGNTTTEYLRVAANGNVGIGNSSPAAKLHVQGNAIVESINSGPLAGHRNALINGNFDVWQRGTSFNVTTNGTYTADRWVSQFDGSGATRTVSRQEFTLGQTDVPYSPRYYLRFDQSVAGSSATFNIIQQRIENVRTFAGRQVTLSLYLKASAPATMDFITIRQYFGSGGSPSSYVDTGLTGDRDIGTSWAKYSYTVTLPSISGKTLGSNGNDSLDILIAFPKNTTFTIDMAQVQLEAGPVATPFEMRPIGHELSLCQRYYAQTSFNNRTYAAGAGQSYENSIYWPTYMFRAPDVTLSVTPVNCTAVVLNPSTLGARAAIVSSSGGDAYALNGIVTADAEIPAS